MTRRAGPKPLFFDVWSRFYDAPLVQRLTYRPVHDAVLRALREVAPRRLLDVGCGTGLLATRLRGELPGLRVVGCDFSHGMLRQAVAHGRRDGPARPAGATRPAEATPGAVGPRARRPCEWVQGDAQRLPFHDAGFDALVSTEAFHWFPDPDRALAEFFRVLSPGGRLVVVLAHPPLRLLTQITAAGSRLLGEPLSWPTREAMRARVEKAGFRVHSQSRVLRLPFPLLFPAVMTVALR